MALRTWPISAAAEAPLPMTSPDAEEDALVTQLEHVVPVAAGVGAGHARPVLGVERQPVDRREGVGQHGTLQHFGDHVLPLEPRGVGQGHPGPAGHFGGE